jgi:hypothetical protein
MTLPTHTLSLLRKRLRQFRKLSFCSKNAVSARGHGVDTSRNWVRKRQKQEQKRRQNNLGNTEGKYVRKKRGKK